MRVVDKQTLVFENIHEPVHIVDNAKNIYS
jgi:hypothetical protein